MKRLLLITILLGVSAGHADSPLTSTDFYRAYNGLPLVQRAAKTRTLSDTMSRYLSNPKHPIGIKAAVINALSWNSQGKTNALKYRQFLATRYKTSGRMLNLTQLNSHELFSLGYMSAMDDYRRPARGLRMLQKAREKNARSYTIAIVTALVQAQQSMDSDWCKTWYVTQQVKEQAGLNRDLREGAIKIIFDYMALYKKYCDR